LRNNNQLFPGQNRTQALRLEGETGGINPAEDSVLKPMLKPKLIIPPIHIKRNPAKTHRAPRLVRNSARSNSAYATHSAPSALNRILD
jgi:hypothetical protein